MKKIVFLFFLIVCMFFIETLYAEKTRFSNEQDVTIILDGIPRIAAQEVIEIYPRVKRELEKTFKWKLNIAPTILLTNNKKTFQEITAHKLIVAVALPQKNLIVIDYSRTVARPYTFSMILKHELCHILLHQHITHGNMPRWLDEGVSQWASSGISEILINTKHSVLDEAIIAGHYISMRNLTERFPEDEKPLLLAYAESKSFVEYIVSKYGSNALLEVLAYLKEGDEIHLALRKGLSIPLEELERSK
ncbi:MAG: peptidase MA family metallohydrolase [Thermodesulfobacteriota bacterium]|nr:peptidase MA family metallohydrolase [Thermodesulfobacteriota bacterium]